MAESEVEGELGACPGGCEGEILRVVVDDEPSQSENTGIVTTNARNWGVTHLYC